MQLFTINTGLFKLDGGAMFGVVPKKIWQKQIPPDEENLCTFAMRCLLVATSERLILIDTGCGNKQDVNFFKHYHLHGNDTLIKSIRQAGFFEDEITDVILTHLHFDHAGGATRWNSEKTQVLPTFKNARYHVSAKQWNWACQPNAREAASFLKENFLPIQTFEQLNFVEMDTIHGIPEIKLTYVFGHTEQMIVPTVSFKNKKISFVTDLIPTIAHLPIPYLASYDIRPLEAMSEKLQFLQQAYEENQVLFFEHDALHEVCTLKLTEKGYRADQTFTLREYLHAM